MAREIHYQSAAELARKIRTGELSPVDVVDAHFERIRACDGALNAYVDLFEDDAREQAKAAEAAVRNGEELGPLHGVPLSVKDNIAVGGKRYTNGVVPFADNVADEDDVTVTRLKEAGAIVIGKTNLPAFATKAVTDNGLFGPTGNPFDPGKMSGGSSGGAAAAAAAGMAPLNIGTDGGGSARIPASACGVFGMKPTFGRLPTPLRPDGFVHYNPMRGKGPLTRTVEDGALMLEAMAGYHPDDPFSLPDDDADYVAATRQSIRDLDVAYSVDMGAFPIDDRVEAVFEDAVETLAETGASLTEDAPAFGRSREEMLRSWQVGFFLVLAESLDLLKEREGVDLLGDHRDDLEAHNVEAAETGMEMSAVDYRKNDAVRTEVFQAVQDLFAEYDLLVTPTLAVPPFEHGIWGPTEVAGESVEEVIGWCLTWLFNMTGHPAASVPAGFTDDGLPVGLQIVGPRFGDETVLAAAGAYERIDPWHDEYERVDAVLG
jgi:Asp-tRNA(Asn)/Glu-tRNA(Gln) amidotransferase A subunit family amidase